MNPLRLKIDQSLQRAVGQMGVNVQGGIVRWQAPREFAHGDWSTPWALVWAKRAGRPPMELAEALTETLRRIVSDDPLLRRSVERVEVAAPGFVNLFWSGEALGRGCLEAVSQKDHFGSSRLGKGRKVIVEFVSANPTGPLTVAHGRQAAVGDALCRILEFSGYRVDREFFVNDEGRQMNLLGLSLQARVREALGQPLELPADGYQGQYLTDLARTWIRFLRTPKSRTRMESLPSDAAPFRRFAQQRILQGIRKDLAAFGVRFDRYFSQAALSRQKRVEQVLQDLGSQGLTYESEGALWFASTRAGDDKDRVLKKSDGSFTYLAPDIAYHREKIRRGYNWAINLWGPDHHGYIPRMKAAWQALGQNPDTLKVLIIQLVTLERGGQPLRMSTRAGEFVTLAELVTEVGRDAARFFYLLRRRDTHLNFDLDLAKQKSQDNPVYYIQYAHARICRILEKAPTRWAKRLPSARVLGRLLQSPVERELLRRIIQFEPVVQWAAEELEPYALLNYLQEFARLFHQFYTQCKVLDDDSRVRQSRLLAVCAARVVLANGLELLGVRAPKKM